MGEKKLHEDFGEEVNKRDELTFLEAGVDSVEVSHVESHQFVEVKELLRKGQILTEEDCLQLTSYALERVLVELL